MNPEILDRTSNLTDATKLPEKADAINRKERYNLMEGELPCVAYNKTAIDRFLLNHKIGTSILYHNSSI